MQFLSYIAQIDFSKGGNVTPFALNLNVIEYNVNWGRLKLTKHQRIPTFELFTKTIID